MKLSLLFAKYLYQHKQLNLPGIGIFSIDPSVAIPEITDKNHHDFIQHIRFSQKSVARPEDDLIDFIRTHTGKIRPLAESDIESFLSEGKILLNIGKPFHLEGIGTLLKGRTGTYEFHPGLPLIDRLENFFPEKDTKAAKQSYDNEYGAVSKSNSSGRTVWVVLSILVGLTAIIWGGYSLYNRDTGDDGTVGSENVAGTQPVSATLPDTTRATRADSASIIADSPQVKTNTAAPGLYKFIIRSARNKNYILKRYNDLRSSTANLYWDTKDSVVYRLYLAISSSPADTSRIRDSLQSWYGSKKVTVEQ